MSHSPATQRFLDMCEGDTKHEPINVKAFYKYKCVKSAIRMDNGNVLVNGEFVMRPNGKWHVRGKKKTYYWNPDNVAGFVKKFLQTKENNMRDVRWRK